MGIYDVVDFAQPVAELSWISTMSRKEPPRCSVSHTKMEGPTGICFKFFEDKFSFFRD